MPYESSCVKSCLGIGSRKIETLPFSPASLGDHGRQISRVRTRSHRNIPATSQPDQHDREALHELFRASRERYFRVAYRILRNKQDAEDAVQDAFLSAHRHHRDFEGRAALATWLTRIVMNAALMLRRKRANLLLDSIQEHGVHTPQWTETIAAPQPDPESLCAGKEAHETIQHSLNRMAPLLRQAFVMTYFEELPLKESSARLGVPLSTFKARLFRAKRQLIGKTKISLPILSPKNVEFSVRLKNRTLPTFREFHTESPSYGFDSAATD